MMWLIFNIKWGSSSTLNIALILSLTKDEGAWLADGGFLSYPALPRSDSQIPPSTRPSATA